MEHQTPGTPGRAALERRLAAPSLVDHFYDFLELQDVEIPAERRSRDVTLPAVADECVQRGILRLYRTRPDVAILFEQMIDYDEGQQEWRYRHVKMVERTIGARMGTGGSAGAEYLRTTLSAPFFPDLWAIRSEL
jgi:tryptophan 2,3-dioxygenase